MVAFIKLVLALCLLQVGPQDMPAGRGFLVLAAAAYSTVVAVVFSLTEWQLSPALLTVQATLFLAFATALVLSFAGHGTRIQQTLTALYASSAVMSLIPLLLRQLLQADGTPSILANAVFLVLFFWSFAIDSLIFSRALNTNMWIGLLVSVILFIMNQILLSPWQGAL